MRHTHTRSPSLSRPISGMTEQTGALAQVVEAYFQGDVRTPSQQKILASYLHQYV
jgi:hypothetical protein